MDFYKNQQASGQMVGATTTSVTVRHAASIKKGPPLPLAGLPYFISNRPIDCQSGDRRRPKSRRL